MPDGRLEVPVIECSGEDAGGTSRYRLHDLIRHHAVAPGHVASRRHVIDTG